MTQDVTYGNLGVYIGTDTSGNRVLVIDTSESGDIVVDGASLIDEIKAISGFDLTEAGYLNGASTTVTASKVIVADGSKNVSSINNLTAVGTITLATATGATCDIGDADSGAINIKSNGAIVVGNAEANSLTLSGGAGLASLDGTTVAVGPATTSTVDIGSATAGALSIKSNGAITVGNAEANSLALSGGAGLASLDGTTVSVGPATTSTVDIGSAVAGAVTVKSNSTITIGNAEADSITFVSAGATDIGVSGQATTIKGTFNVDEAATFDTTVGVTGSVTSTAGAATPAVALRFGDTATEGLEVKVYDETIQLTNAVKTDSTLAVPAGAVVLSAQANLQAIITGDGTGDNLLAAVGLGISGGDEDKYGNTTDLTANQKIDTIPDWAVNGGETISIFGLQADGNTAATEKFTGGAGQNVRVRVVYLQTNSLDDAA
jgi:hypothetical protein